jgi:hypothetical protein
MDNNLQKDFTIVGINQELAELFNLDIKSNYNLDLFITNLFHEVIETKFEIEI